MLTLQHQHKYMVGKAVLVNGHVYKVDAQRCITDVPVPDADKLLLSSVWRKVGPVAPPVGVAPQPPPAKQPPEPPAPAPEPVQVEAEAEYVDPPIPNEGDDWPDPDERMSMEYLRLMGDAYDVTVRSNAKKQTLIDRIKKAMYEDDE